MEKARLVNRLTTKKIHGHFKPAPRSFDDRPQR